jgi:hypothetical protein
MVSETQNLTLAWRNEEPSTGVAPQTVTHTYRLAVRSSEPPGASGPPSVLDLRRGVVSLDGLSLSRPKITSYWLSWGQKTPEGRSFGRLHISKDRLWLSGDIGISKGDGAPSVFRVIGVAEAQEARLSDGRHVSFQYEPDPLHPGRVVPSVQVEGQKLSGELNTSLGQDGTLALEHPGLPSHVSVIRPSDSDAAETIAIAPRSETGAVDPAELTVENLAAQGIGDIEADSQAAFVQNMSEALEPQWSQAFLPQSSNVTSDPSRMCLVDQDAEWYNATYAPAFLGYGLSTDSSIQSKYKLTDDQVNNVQYFLDEDLACDEAYIRQSNVAMIPAAIAATQSASPNMGDYLNDTTHPQGYWADQLLAYLTLPAQLQPLYDAAPDASGDFQAQELQNVMQEVNSNAMLLTVLDPSGQHAGDYYNAVYAAVFGGLLQNVTVSTDATFYTTWLEEFLNQFIDYYNANQDSEPTDVSSLAMWTAGKDFDTAADFLKGADNLASAIALAFSSATPNNSLTAIALRAAAAFTSQQNPIVAAAASKYFVVFATAGLFINGLLGLGNIDSMSPEQITASVNNLAGLMSGLMGAAPDILNLGTIGAVYTDAKALLMILQDGIFQDLAAMTKLVAAAGATPTVVGKWLQQRVQGAGAGMAINAGGTVFSRILKNVAIVGKYLGALTAVVAAGISLWQLMDDILAGGDAMTVALDVAASAFAFASAAATIAALTSESIIPAIVAGAAALGGVIVGVLATFFQQGPPPNPVDEYLQNVATPFAAALPTPQGWVAPTPVPPAAALGAKVRARLAALSSTAVPKLVTA